MADEDKMKLLSELMKNANVGYIIMDNHGTMNINQHDKESGSDNKSSERISADMVGEALNVAIIFGATQPMLCLFVYVAMCMDGKITQVFLSESWNWRV